MAENRVRVQIVAGNLLWKNNRAARVPFLRCGQGVAS